MKKLLCLLFVCSISFAAETEKLLKKSAELTKQENRKKIDFFEHTLGITENDFKKLSQAQKKQFCCDGNLVNGKTNQRFSHGTFVQHSIKELRELAEKKEKPGGGSFSIIEAYDKPWENWFRRYVDTGALQAKYNDAVFQVASNFNALEGGGSPHAGLMDYLSPYLFVQGECAAISANPGLLYRLYFMPHERNGKTYYGQLEQQTNLIEAIANDNWPNIPMHNGYPGSIENNQILANLKDEQYNQILEKVCIGFHSDISVPLGLSKQKSEYPDNGRYSCWELNTTNNTINQVFTAAFNLAGLNPQLPAHKNCAQLFLDAAYEGTLKSAFIHGKKKVFLTLIGGGVFQNDLEWISRSIYNAVHSFVESSGLQVCLIIYWSGSYPKEKFDIIKQQLFTLVSQTNGHYLRYKKDGLFEVIQTNEES